MANTPPPDWRTLASQKRDSLLSKIPQSWRIPPSSMPPANPQNPTSTLHIPASLSPSILTSRELDLTSNYDATALGILMADGKATSVEMTTAFCKRAAVAHQLVNCLTEVFFEEALSRARWCDGEREAGRARGGLWGVPVSLKDSYNVKNIPSTIGYISFLSQPPPTENSPIVDILLSAGCVLYCKTNLPQSMMTADSDNNIFGRTLNPHNTLLTAGGSTGGEGALIAMRGSVLGLATDVAGSCRIPAVCNGLTSFKPTAARLPFGGTPPGRLGSPGSIVPVVGPQGVSVRDCELLIRTVIDSEPWELDANVIAVPWRKLQPFTRPLRFGLVRGHAKRPLHPPVARALHETAMKLKGDGHEIVLLDDKIPDLWDSAVVAWKYFMLDPEKTPAKHVAASGEPWVPSIATMRFEETQGWEPTMNNLWELNMERMGIVKRWHDVVVQEKLDAVLMAGYQATAVPHDTFGVPIYTVLQNLLNYPSGILPFGKASQKLDEPFLKEEIVYEPPYQPDLFEGVPTTVQVMGRPMKDEELVEIMKVVETLLTKA